MRSSINPPPDEHQHLLSLAESYLQEFVAPQATAIDESSEALGIALKGLGDRGLLALKVPKTYQGSGFSPEKYHRFQEMVARYSGVLAFLQTQHQSAGAWIANSGNEVLQQEYLSPMKMGRVLVGVGYSQLRRSGDPPMRATPVAGGYQLEGTVPWITGYGFFDDFIIGAISSEGEAVYGLMPFRATPQKSGGRLQFSLPMQLIAMESACTVRATVAGWFLPEERVVATLPRDRIHQSDRQNVLNHGFFALGCARAALDLLQEAHRRKQLPFLLQAYQALDRELQDCRTKMFHALPPQQDGFESRLQLRAWAINLAGRCAQAAVAASSGAANGKSHPAGRVYREALMFEVFGQTQAVMEVTLAQLLRP